MTSPRLVGVNTQVVVSGIIDSEAVILNLGNGMYYTMENVGAEIWRMIGEGHSIRAMSTMLSARYTVPEDQVQTDIECLARELLEEGLVLELEPPDGNPVVMPLPYEGSATPYSQPVLMKYSDMGDVLALDPPLPRLETGTAVAKPR